MLSVLELLERLDAREWKVTMTRTATGCRTCGVEVGGTKCGVKVRDPYAKRCPRGHLL